MIFHCVNIQIFIFDYSFSSQWISGLFSILRHLNIAVMNIHCQDLFFFFCSFAFVCIALNFLRNLGVEFWGYNEYIFFFFTKELQIILHSASSSLFLLAMYENLHYSIFFSEFGVVNLNFIYFYWHVVVTHSLNLQFPDD